MGKVKDITYRAGGATWFVVSGHYKSTGNDPPLIYYAKFMFSSDLDRVAGFEITYSVWEKSRMDSVVDHIEAEFSHPLVPWAPIKRAEAAAWFRKLGNARDQSPQFSGGGRYEAATVSVPMQRVEGPISANSSCGLVRGAVHRLVAILQFGSSRTVASIDSMSPCVGLISPARGRERNHPIATIIIAEGGIVPAGASQWVSSGLSS